MQRDAEIGRIYAPRELWDRHGVTEAQLLGGKTLPCMQAMLEEFTEIAENYLVQGGELVHRVPRWLALDVRLFRAGGLAIIGKSNVRGTMCGPGDPKSALAQAWIAGQRHVETGAPPASLTKNCGTEDFLSLRTE